MNSVPLLNISVVKPASSHAGFMVDFSDRQEAACDEAGAGESVSLVSENTWRRSPQGNPRAFRNSTSTKDDKCVLAKQTVPVECGFQKDSFIIGLWYKVVKHHCVAITESHSD